MHLKTYLIGIFILSIFLIAGCGDSLSGSVIKFSSNKITGLASIGGVYGMWENWDSDIEDDGLVLTFIFYDNDGNMISFDDVPLKVDLKLYTMVDEEKDRVVYEDNFEIKSSKEVDIFNKGIKIPKEKIDIKEGDEKYGTAEIVVHTSEQGDFSAKGKFIQLYQ